MVLTNFVPSVGTHDFLCFSLPCLLVCFAIVGPARVWLARQDIPGLAMSRSFGDEVAQTVGVISDPDVRAPICFRFSTEKL